MLAQCSILEEHAISRPFSLLYYTVHYKDAVFKLGYEIAVCTSFPLADDKVRLESSGRGILVHDPLVVAD